MAEQTAKMEKLLIADGSGAFGHIEYDEESRVILRSAYMKTADTSGSIRFYFNAKREEVVTGRKFDPVGGQWLLRSGSAYRIYTNIVFEKPIPKGGRVEIVPTPDAADVLMIADPVLREGFEGRVYFTVIPFRRIQLDEYVSLARLVVSDPPAKASKSTNYSRPKKTTAKSKTETDESITPDEHSEPEEA